VSDGIKLQGLDDIRRLQDRPATWTPPAAVNDFLDLVRAVIVGSKYTDRFLTNPDAVEELRTVIRMKADRVRLNPDLEETVDVAAYAALLFVRLVRDGAGVGSVQELLEGKP